MNDFILEYVQSNQDHWKVKPEIITGEDFQDCLILKFGHPRTAVFAHMDSTGFSVRYNNQLVPIGSPEVETGLKLVGQDKLGPVECTLHVSEDHQLSYNFGRGIERGTTLVYKSNFRETEEYVQSCYLDNRLGIYNALQLCEVLENGIIAFSCWEEHGGGSVGFLARHIYEQFMVRQALICDITWITDGIHHGEGVVISIRDRGIPRRGYIEKIINIAEESGVTYQLEVEATGSSDGGELQSSPYPFDWCFVGAPEDNVHSPDEIVHKNDIDSMLELYLVLMKTL